MLSGRARGEWRNLLPFANATDNKASLDDDTKHHFIHDKFVMQTCNLKLSKYCSYCVASEVCVWHLEAVQQLYI